MSKIFSKAWLAFITIILIGCGGGGGNNVDIPQGNNQPTSPETKFNDASINGGFATQDGTIGLSPYINDGGFYIEWDVTSSDPFHISMYVSDDQSLDDTDVQFGGFNCGSLTELYSCTFQDEKQCSYDEGNLISCGEITSGNPAKNLSNYLDVIPKQTNILVRVCNGLFSDCETVALNIILL